MTPTGGCALTITIPVVVSEPSSFQPRDASVKQGQCVTWLNQDNEAHTATDRGRAFDTGIVHAGASVSLLAAAAGTYTYFCKLHPHMGATLAVTSG
jgi:plastocyanin